jgi:hypothetical protein
MTAPSVDVSEFIVDAAWEMPWEKALSLSYI